jgi:hypothetical protein
MGIFNFFVGRPIIKDEENWLTVLKSSARRGFMILGSNGKAIFDPGEEKCLPTLSCTHLFMLGTLKDVSMPPTRNSKTTNVFFHLPVLTVSRESIMRV